MSLVDDVQVGGNHYTSMGIQPWEVIEKNNLNFWQGTIIGYVMRDKGEYIKDLKKARHTLDKYIAVLEAKKKPQSWYETIAGKTPKHNTDGSCWKGITEGELKDKANNTHISDEEWDAVYLRHCEKYKLAQELWSNE